LSQEAKKYQVYPLDNSVLTRVIAPRPSATAGRTVFTYTGELPGTLASDAPSILNKSYNIRAEIAVPESGAEGMLVTEGGRFGGYGLYLLKGKPVFLYNFVGLEKTRWEGPDALAPGKHTLKFDFKYDGPGFGKGGTGFLSVDDKEVANHKIAHTIPFLITIDETFDVGMDTRTPVDDKDYQVPFRFTGTIAKVEIELHPSLGGLEPTGRPKEKSELTPTRDKLQVSLPNDGSSMSGRERALYLRMMQWWALHN
jgi:arylsulfatase